MRQSFRRALLALPLVLLPVAPIVACRRGAASEAPVPQVPATLRVENRGFADMVIYLVSSAGTRQRLGIATGSSTSRFQLPLNATAFGNVRFIADPIGGRRAPVSEEIAVHPGDEVVLEIPPA